VVYTKHEVNIANYKRRQTTLSMVMCYMKMSYLR